MTTLLITHPASLNHLNGTGHPERPDRIRAIESVLEQEKFQPLVREQAPRGRARNRRALPSDGLHRGNPERRAEGRPGAARRRHLDVARQLRGGAARGRRRDARGRRGGRQEGRQCLRRAAAARPSRRDGAADGFLHLQPGGDRGALRPEAARPASRRRGRLRRAPRQRHAGDFLERPDADVLLDASDAALSRHRRGRRTRRARQHRQRAAARRRRRRAVQGGDGDAHPAAAVDRSAPS